MADKNSKHKSDLLSEIDSLKEEVKKYKHRGKKLKEDNDRLREKIESEKATCPSIEELTPNQREIMYRIVCHQNEKLKKDNEDLLLENKRLSDLVQELQEHKHRLECLLDTDEVIETSNIVPWSECAGVPICTTTSSVTEGQNKGEKKDGQEAQPEVLPVWKKEGVSIAEQLESAANEALGLASADYSKSTTTNQSTDDMTWHEQYQMYYSDETKHYYSQDMSMSYNPTIGTYYSYNTDSGAYEYHSTVDVATMDKHRASNTVEMKRHGRKDRKKEKKEREKHSKHRRRAKKRKKRLSGDNSDHEDGEIDTSSDSIKSTSGNDSDARMNGDGHVKVKRKHSAKSHRAKSSKRRVHSDCKKNALSLSIDNDAPSNDNWSTSADDTSCLSPSNTCERQTASSNDSCDDAEFKENKMQQEAMDDAAIIESGPRPPSDSSQWAPCIRLVVVKSDTLSSGSLYIITYNGATVGSDQKCKHQIYIDDPNVSKYHMEFSYDQCTRCYTIQDKGSTNGTLLNDTRLSEAHEESETHKLTHLDHVSIAMRHVFECHIHVGTDTCNDCEPGVTKYQQQKDVRMMSAAEKDQKRRDELKALKQKYHIQGAGRAHLPKQYSDRAAQRRVTVGSDNPHIRDEHAASVNVAIPSENKGYRLLQKMGWQEGSGLGREETGIAEPIQSSIRKNTKAGLGSSRSQAGETSLDNAGETDRQQKWRKANERYEKLTDEHKSTDQTDGKSEKIDMFSYENT